MQKQYKHLFFDLDRTLWDFDANNRQTFTDLHHHFSLSQRGVMDALDFYTRYQPINMGLWDLYKKQQIHRDELNFKRFYDTLMLFEIADEKLALEMGNYYVKQSPLQTLLYPHTHQILETLHRKYQLHIITNGFEDVQYIKIEKCNLGKYFTNIITSERAGFKKPDKRIFEFAMSEAGATVEESILIGDDPEADITGAMYSGMDQIWVKHPPVKESVHIPTFEVNTLKEILDIL